MGDKTSVPNALKDSALFFGAQLGARFLNFGYFLILTQTLPIDEFGVLNYALSIIILLDIFLDLGLSRHAMREVSKDHGAGGDFIRRILPYKFAASTVVFIAFFLVAILSDQPTTYKAINIFAALGLFFTSPAMLLDNILQAHNRFALISFAHIILSVFQFAVGVFIIWLGGSTILISLTFALTYFVYAGIVAWGVLQLSPKIPARADYKALVHSIPSSFPYLVSAVVVMFAIRAEFVILGFFGSKSDLAVFGMATKIVEASLLLPMAFTTVMSPRFSRAHGQSRSVLKSLYRNGMEMILLLSIPINFVAFALVPLVQVILGTSEYDAIDDMLYISFFGFTAASVFLYNTSVLFGAVNQTKPLIILTFFGLLQIAINLILQSAFGMWGAAVAFVVFMGVAALGSTVAILTLYTSPSGMGKALSAPAVGLATVLLALQVLGTGPVSYLFAIVVFSVVVYGFRVIFAAWTTDLNLDPKGI